MGESTENELRSVISRARDCLEHAGDDLDDFGGPGPITTAKRLLEGADQPRCDHCGKPERFNVLCPDCEQLACLDCGRVECVCDTFDADTVRALLRAVDAGEYKSLQWQADLDQLAHAVRTSEKRRRASREGGQ